MKESDKTQKQLIKELTQLRQRIAELEQSEIERKQAEKALQTANERLHYLLTSTSAAIYTSKTSGDYGATSITENVKQMTGYEPREFIENSSFWLDHVHPEDRQRILNELPRLFKKGSYAYEYRFLHKDGHYMWIRDDMRLIKDESKKPIEIIGYWIDITESRQVQEALQESEEKYRLLFENANDALYLHEVSREGPRKIFAANEAACRMLGYTHEELLQMTVADIDVPEQTEKIPAILDRLFSEGNAVFETEHLRKDGARVQVLVSIRTFDLHGTKVMLSIVTDITERKKMEEALKESEQRLRAIFEGAIDGILLADIETRKFHAANTMICTMLGYSLEEVKNLGVIDIHPQEALPFVMEQFDKLARGEITKTSDLPVKRKDGSVFYAEISSVMLKLDAGTYLMGTFRDITDRRRAEEALKESETQFRTLFEAIPDTVLVHDDEGIILHINEIGAQKLEWPAKDLVGRNLREIVTHENAVSIANHVRETHKAGWSRFETTYVSRSGWQIMAEVHERPIKFGTKKAILSVARNITERKRAEKELQESEERFRLAFENANTGVCLVDLEGNLTRVNARMCEIFGYTKEELERMTVNDIAHPEDIYKSPMFIQETLEGKIDRGTFEKRYFHKKGHVVTCQVSSSLVRDAEGLPLYFISHVHDITRRKQAEKDLQHSYEQTKNTLVSTVKALASTVEMKDQYTAGHQQRVTHLACAIAEEMGLPEEQIKGIHMAGLIHDIGKLVVPAEILNKPGPLTEMEYEMMKMHPQDGYYILKGIEFPWPVAQIILQHQEVMDGSGYPQGLSGEQIMIEARILRVANVIESMTAHRPYRPAFSLQEAIEEISINRGILYDPAVVDACLKLLAEKGFTFD